MLDGPYANGVWNGREIAVVDVPADAPREARNYDVPVPAVEGLTGKHAIYLVVEGPEVPQSEQPQGRPQRGRQMPQRPQGLLDLHGIGFSKNGSLAISEVAPQPEVVITVDGQRLNMPATPLYSTNANGYTECSNYQLYAPLRDNSQLKATATNPEVHCEVSAIVAGRVSVKATFRGKTKTFLIN